jgi:hypothetical protein
MTPETASEGARDVLADMKTGDFLMLLESSDFRYVGQVIHRVSQPCWDLSRHIWSEQRFPIIIHESRQGSSAFVFDMMEPERPKVDRSVLEFVKSHKFHAADFVIRSDGVCRLNPEMARHVAEVVYEALV